MEKTAALVVRMRAAAPMRALATTDLRKTLQQGSNRAFPRECRITEIFYMGDEGGIGCKLDFGFSGTKEAQVVSITHLRFDRGAPLAREIEAYCKHRVKRLKKLHGGTVLS